MMQSDFQWCLDAYVQQRVFGGDLLVIRDSENESAVLATDSPVEVTQ